LYIYTHINNNYHINLIKKVTCGKEEIYNNHFLAFKNDFKYHITFYNKHYLSHESESNYNSDIEETYDYIVKKLDFEQIKELIGKLDDYVE